MPRRLLAPPLGEYIIYCPSCRRKLSLRLTAGWNYWRCPKCDGKAKFLLATVRAKKGRNERSVFGGFSHREYSVRYIDSSGEGLLRFSSHSREDIELRSGDAMIVVFPKKRSHAKKRGKAIYSKNPRRVYNCSIGRYFQIE